MNLDEDYQNENEIQNNVLNQNIIIYGLDADLIMLALVSQKNNIYLLRERIEYGSYSFEFGEYKYLYLDINCLKISILNEIIPLVPDIQLHIKNNSSNDLLVKIINDYVFINFILGNDFIPKIPWFSISNRFNEELLHIYCRLYNQHRQFLINYSSKRLTINYQLLNIFFECLSNIEDEFYLAYYQKRQRKWINMRDVENEKERQERLLKMFPLQHLDIEKEINPYEGGISWRSKYYKICFNMNMNKQNMNSICYNYLESINWTFKYYFQGEINWDWSYKYQYAPAMKNIVDYMNEKIKDNNTNKTRTNSYYNINNIKFNKGKPVTQQQLLLMVLPTDSKDFQITINL